MRLFQVDIFQEPQGETEQKLKICILHKNRMMPLWYYPVFLLIQGFLLRWDTSLHFVNPKEKKGSQKKAKLISKIC